MRKKAKPRGGIPYEFTDSDVTEIDASLRKQAAKFQARFPHLVVDDIVQRCWRMILRSVLPTLRKGDKGYMGLIYRCARNEMINMSHNQYRWVSRFGFELDPETASSLIAPDRLADQVELHDYYDSVSRISSPLLRDAIEFLKQDHQLKIRDAVAMLGLSKRDSAMLCDEFSGARDIVDSLADPPQVGPSVSPCFCGMYNPRTRECQICAIASQCQLGGTKRKNPATSPAGLCILTFLREKGPATASEINELLGRSLSGAKINTHNWLNILKSEGFIRITNEGRARTYVAV